MPDAADSAIQSSDAPGTLEGERIASLELAGFCKWLDEALATERYAIGLEIERQHQHILASCAQRLGFSHDQYDATHTVISSLREKESSEPPGDHAIWAPGVGGAPAGFRIDQQVNGHPPEKVSAGKPAGKTDSAPGGDEGGILIDASAFDMLGRSRKSGKRNPWSSNSGSKPERFTHRLAESHTFELTFAFLIVTNTMIMAAELQYIGMGVGHKLNYPTFHRPKEDIWPGAEGVFIVLDWFFGVLFMLEVIIKMIGLRRDFCCDDWNVFDFAIVAAWLIGALTRDIATLPLDPMLLRLARFAKLLRLVKLLRFLHGIDQLYLMMTTLKGSTMVLFWSSLFLLVCQTMFAFLCNQIIVSYYLDIDGENRDIVRQRETFEYFGTFSRSMLSMFEITLGNWAPIARNLYENVSAWWMLFSLLHKLSMGFAVVGIINGIFIQETFKVAACDDTVMLLQEDRARRVHAKKMQALFEETDANGDGRLDREEFCEVIQNPKIKGWLAAQELDASDADTLYTLMAPADGEGLDALALVTGVKKLKGTARNLDVAMLRHEHQQTAHSLQKISDSLLFMRNSQMVGSLLSTHSRINMAEPLEPVKHAVNGNGLYSAFAPPEPENKSNSQDIAQESFDESAKVWADSPAVANADGMYQDDSELLFPLEFSGEGNSPRGTRPHGLPGRSVLL